MPRLALTYTPPSHSSSEPRYTIQKKCVFFTRSLILSNLLALSLLRLKKYHLSAAAVLLLFFWQGWINRTESVSVVLSGTTHFMQTNTDMMTIKALLIIRGFKARIYTVNEQRLHTFIYIIVRDSQYQYKIIVKITRSFPSCLVLAQKK